MTISSINESLASAQRFAEALEVDNFTLAKEFQDIVDTRVIRQFDPPVVGSAGVLLSCYVLSQIRDGVTFCLDIGYIEITIQDIFCNRHIYIN